MNPKAPIETDTIDRLFLELSQVTRARTIRDMEFEFALRDANDTCRSMHAIVERKGESTNWEEFKAILQNSLENQRYALEMHGEKK